jgi:hypothetical protein
LPVEPCADIISQDDLAEHAIPDAPGYVEEWDDLTRYEYWNDIEYDSDGYYDINESQPKPPTKTAPEMAGRKRKASPLPRGSRKRRRVQDTLDDALPPILLLSKEALKQRGGKRFPQGRDPESLPEVSLLADWRTRFPNIKPIGVPEQDAHAGHVEEAEHDGQDEAGGVDGATEDVLRRALEDNLRGLSVNMGGVDQSVLLELAQRMMNNEPVDDILEDYMEELVVDDEDADDEEEQDEEEAPARHDFRGWVSAEGRQRASRQSVVAASAEQAPTEPPATSSTGKGVKRRASTSPAVTSRKKKTRQQPDEVEAQG